MAFHALLVSEDNESISVVSSALSRLGMTAQSCGYRNGVFFLPDHPIDALIIDFEDSRHATSIMEIVKSGTSQSTPLIVGIIKNQSDVRKVLNSGANFVLYKPLSIQQADATLRAAAALIRRERRRCFRVPVQAPVQILLGDGSEREGILLDLSEGGLDVVASQPIRPGSLINVGFVLPGANSIVLHCQVVWANPNGQCGMRFVDLPENLHNTLKSWIDKNAENLRPGEPEPVSKCRLSDLSLGGCYVETESPFPERSGLQLCFRVDGIEIEIEGVVRIMHPQWGMGIEFAKYTQAQRNEVRALLNLLSSRAGVEPQLKIKPTALTAEQDFKDPAATAELSDDALLQLLRSHETFNQEEFLQELHRQRHSAAVS